jgi:hypothetical protein
MPNRTGDTIRLTVVSQLHAALSWLRHYAASHEAASHRGASREAASARKGGPTKSATTKSATAKGGPTEATATKAAPAKAAIKGRCTQRRSGRDNRRGDQSNPYLAHDDAAPLLGDAPQPLGGKLHISH